MLDDKNNNHQGDDGFTLLEFFNYLKKNIIIIIVLVLGFLALGIFYTWFIVTPMYTSKGSISFRIEHSNSYATTYAYMRNLLPVQEELLRREEFIDIAIERAKDSDSPVNASAAKISENLSISVNNDKLIVYISIKDDDPEQAYNIVKAIINTAVEEIDYSQEENNIVVKTFIVNYPKKPYSPSSPNKLLNVIISLMVGGIAAIIVVLLKEQFSGHFRSTEEIEKFTRYPILGEIYEQKDIKGD